MLAGKSILVVEDSYLIAEDMADRLQEARATVIGPFPGCSEALQAMKTASPDAAVLNIALNSETVYPVAEVLQRQGVPFVFFTGLSGEGRLRPEFADVPVVLKPGTAEMIRAVVTLLAERDAD